jgi:ribosomal protein L12E/L44/L45/RPP1/RPP2
MDRAVLTAYGWADLIDKVPPFTTPESEADKQALAAFEDAVIDRLFTLNAERAAAEAIAGQGTAPAGKPPKKISKRKEAESQEPPKQASLFGREKTRGK